MINALWFPSSFECSYQVVGEIAGLRQQPQKIDAVAPAAIDVSV